MVPYFEYIRSVISDGLQGSVKMKNWLLIFFLGLCNICCNLLFKFILFCEEKSGHWTEPRTCISQTVEVIEFQKCQCFIQTIVVQVDEFR